MLAQLFYSNFNFSLKVFAALVFLSTAILHWDSYKIEKERIENIYYVIGFFLLAISEIIFATIIKNPYPNIYVQSIKILGLIILIIGNFIEPLPEKPKLKSILIFAPIPLLSIIASPVSASLYIILAIFFLRKYKDGLFKQVKILIFAFLFLGLSEFLLTSYFWKDTNIVFLFKLINDYSIIWFLHRLFEFIGIILLAIWSWGYIRFRPGIQLFVLFVTSSLMIFLVTTVVFSTLLLRRLENDFYSQLRTDVKVLQYSLESKNFEYLAKADSISNNSNFLLLFEDLDIQKVTNLLDEFLIEYQLSSVSVISKDGNIIAKSEGTESKILGVESQKLVEESLKGRGISSFVVREEYISPVVMIQASSPIRDIDGNVIGTVLVASEIDSAFADGVKNITGLDTSIYANDIRSATTFVSSDGLRLLGIKETDNRVLDSIFTKREEFVGSIKIFNQPYYAAYSPLNSFEGDVVGMLFTGKLQNQVFKTADSAIQQTFVGSVILMLFSIIPAFFISKYIQEHAEA